MRLDAITVDMLARAIDDYRAEAWRNGAPPPPAPRLDGARGGAPVEVVLDRLVDETRREGGDRSRRYALRLGNARYPFMKLVLQEHLVEGEFFFEVDTHDGMFRLEGEDAAPLEALRRYNSEVKARVEERWERDGLPTSAHIKAVVGGLARPGPRNGKHILIADDDADIAQTLSFLLEARGYAVTVLRDGREVLERADPARHDLILMDNEMAELDGVVACRRLKERADTAPIPVLIVTAGQIRLDQLETVDGMLAKPFRVELLLDLIERVLAR